MDSRATIYLHILAVRVRVDVSCIPFSRRRLGLAGSPYVICEVVGFVNNVSVRLSRVPLVSAGVAIAGFGRGVGARSCTRLSFFFFFLLLLCPRWVNMCVAIVFSCCTEENNLVLLRTLCVSRCDIHDLQKPATTKFTSNRQQKKNIKQRNNPFITP